MVYSNNSAYALYAMENERTGRYGADYDNEYEDEYEDDTEQCPYCLAVNPDYYYRDKDMLCFGCSECVFTEKTVRGLHI